jgi:hypothetical protein
MIGTNAASDTKLDVEINVGITTIDSTDFRACSPVPYFSNPSTTELAKKELRADL